MSSGYFKFSFGMSLIHTEIERVNLVFMIFVMLLNVLIGVAKDKEDAN